MKLVVSGPLSRPMTASNSSATLIMMASSPTQLNICKKCFSMYIKCQAVLKSCSFSKLPLDSLLFGKLAARQGLLVTPVKYSSFCRALCGSLSSLKKELGFITSVLHLGNMMWMGEDGNLYEGICRDFPTWGAAPTGRTLAGDGKGSGIPRI